MLQPQHTKSLPPAMLRSPTSLIPHIFKYEVVVGFTRNSPFPGLADARHFSCVTGSLVLLSFMLTLWRLLLSMCFLTKCVKWLFLFPYLISYSIATLIVDHKWIVNFKISIKISTVSILLIRVKYQTKCSLNYATERRFSLNQIKMLYLSCCWYSFGLFMVNFKNRMISNSDLGCGLFLSDPFLQFSETLIFGE